VLNESTYNPPNTSWTQPSVVNPNAKMPISPYNRATSTCVSTTTSSTATSTTRTTRSRSCSTKTVESSNVNQHPEPKTKPHTPNPEISKLLAAKIALPSSAGVTMTPVQMSPTITQTPVRMVLLPQTANQWMIVPQMPGTSPAILNQPSVHSSVTTVNMGPLPIQPAAFTEATHFSNQPALNLNTETLINMPKSEILTLHTAAKDLVVHDGNQEDNKDIEAMTEDVQEPVNAAGK